MEALLIDLSKVLINESPEHCITISNLKSGIEIQDMYHCICNCILNNESNHVPRNQANHAETDLWANIHQSHKDMNQHVLSQSKIQFADTDRFTEVTNRDEYSFTNIKCYKTKYQKILSVSP